MAVLVEALSVVVRCESIVKKFIGGADAYVSSVPNKTLCSDGELAGVNFMAPADVQAYVEYLTTNGLVFKEFDKAIDIVVIDQQRGMTIPCDWVEFGEADWDNNPEQPISVCCLKPTITSNIVVPEGWHYENSLSSSYKYFDGKRISEGLKFVRSDNGIDILLDEKTGQEFYVHRS